MGIWMLRIPKEDEPRWAEIRAELKARAKAEGRRMQWVILELAAFYAKHGLPDEPR